MFQDPDEAHVDLDFDPEVLLLWAGVWRVDIKCEGSDQKLSSIAQVCTMCLPPLPKLENLRLGGFRDDSEPYPEWDWKDDVENNQWLELLRPFTAVKDLYLGKEFQPNVGFALQELVGGRTTEVLPSLQNIFFARSEASGPFQEAIGQFVAARQLSGHSIAVSVWE
jgi:hypothetical protein